MKLKRTIGVIIIICILFSFSSYAGFLDIEKDDLYYEETSVLSALGVINGYEDGNFKPENKVTRAEFCALITRLLGRGEAGNHKMKTNFTDVPYEHWASGYISASEDAGLVNGVGNGKFEPEEEVTYEQAVKIIVSSVGYTPKAEISGGYPSGYMLVGNQIGITKGTVKNEGGQSRQTVIKLLFNALTCPNMSGGFGWGWGISPQEHFEIEYETTILYYRLGIIKADAKITSFDKSIANLKYNSLDECATLNGWSIEENPYGKIPDRISIEGVDLADVIGLPANIYIDVWDDETQKLATDENIKIVIAVPQKGIPTIKTDSNMLISKNNNGYIEYYKTETDEIATRTKIAEEMKVYSNLSSSYSDIKTKADNSRDVLLYKFMDTDKDGIFETVFMEEKPEE